MLNRRVFHSSCWSGAVGLGWVLCMWWMSCGAMCGYSDPPRAVQTRSLLRLPVLQANGADPVPLPFMSGTHVCPSNMLGVLCFCFTLTYKHW